MLSALVVAYALQFQMFLTGLYRLVGRGDRLLILPVLVGYFVVLTAGVGFSLSALQDCSGGICGGSAEMSNVVFALISGGIYLFAAFAVGAVEGERDDRGD